MAKVSLGRLRSGELAHLGVSYFRYAPNVRSPMAHSHREQGEGYVVISGTGRIRLDDEIHQLRSCSISVPAGARLGAVASG